ARASFHAEAAEHAAQLVDHEALREALVAAARIAFRVFAGFDVDALRRAGRGAAQAGHAARRAVGPVREPVHAAEARRVRAALLRVADGVDAVVHGFQARVVALAEHHLLGVLEE